MPQITINLTDAEVADLAEMGIEPESYLKTLCSTHEESKLNEEFMSKTKEEKEDALKPKAVNP